MEAKAEIGRIGLATVLAAVIIAGGMVGSVTAPESVTAQQAQQASLTVSATTTVGDEPVTSIAHEAGQTADVHLEHDGFGEGPHDLRLRLVSWDKWSPATRPPAPFIMTTTVTVSGNSGTTTVVLDEVFNLSNVRTGATLELSVLARGVGPNGNSFLEDTMTMRTVQTTIYLREVPAVARIDEPVTVSYYGWGREPLADGVGLFVDRPPSGENEQGEDTLLTKDVVEPTTTPPAADFFEGGFEFVPERTIDDLGATILLQARPLADVVEVANSNLKEISFNRPPVAVINYKPTSPTALESVSFAASGSFDPDGVIEGYQWDMDGDGEFETSGEFINWTYSGDGPQTVTLLVVDDDGASARTRLPLKVAPTPTVEVTPTPTMEVVPTTTEGPSVWHFGDLDLWVYLAAGGVLLGGLWFRGPLLKLARQATHRLWHDPEPDPDEESDDEKTNHPPVGMALYVPNALTVNRPVLFDGSGSTDPDAGDQVERYRWTVDGHKQSTERFVYLFGKPGDYEVSLEVADTHGATGTWSETIAVKTAGELVLDQAHPDSPGNDYEDLNEEYLGFRNVGETPINLTGWTVHDAAEEEARVRPGTHTFEFGESVELGAEAAVVLHTGAKPNDDSIWEDTDEERHLFWGKRQAVWNNDVDVIVVQDDGGSPVLATRYEQADDGEYVFEELGGESLLEWFPHVDVSVSDEQLELSVSFDNGGVSRSAFWEYIAGALFRRGPRRFLVSWGIATGAIIASMGVGVLIGMDALVAPILLLQVTVLMLVVGVLWLGLRRVLALLRP